MIIIVQQKSDLTNFIIPLTSGGVPIIWYKNFLIKFTHRNYEKQTKIYCQREITEMGALDKVLQHNAIKFRHILFNLLFLPHFTGINFPI